MAHERGCQQEVSGPFPREDEDDERATRLLRRDSAMTIHDDTTDLVIDDEGRPVSLEKERPGPVVQAAYLIGSAGLLIATAADAFAVLGRHVGFAFIGSIEIVQMSVVLVASSAMVAATIVGSHASVHILTERLAKPTALKLARLSDVLSALLFAIVAGASVWVASELWSGFEQTELLGIPLRWFRALWVAAAVLITFLFLRSAVRRSQ
jgi:TRAP-type C4-dicarboxylate transport system permease small subunit